MRCVGSLREEIVCGCIKKGGRREPSQSMEGYLARRLSDPRFASFDARVERERPLSLEHEWIVDRDGYDINRPFITASESLGECRQGTAEKTEL